MCNKTVLGTQNQSKNYGKLVDTLFRKVEIILYTQEKLRLPCMCIFYALYMCIHKFKKLINNTKNVGSFLVCFLFLMV